MGFHGVVEKKVEELADPTITWALIMLGVFLILIAVFMKNKWYKAAILAWVVMP
jgi:hypothetical protein